VRWSDPFIHTGATMRPLPEFPNHTQFATGCRVYGRPRAESDCDTVLLIDPNDLYKLEDVGFRVRRRFSQSVSLVRDQNVIAVFSQAEFRRWRRACEECCRRAPVDKPTARDIIKSTAWGFATDGNFQREEVRRGGRGDRRWSPR
jgi:hypothetical protein